MIEINKIYVGDCIEVMKTWPDNFIDTIITDPPYGLGFMGKDWDGDVPGVYFWAEMLRVCKPGAMLLSFGGTRTWHHLAIAIEKADWKIRDCLMWLYGSGFPKSHNLHGKFEGWGTALKPAWEPIIVAMKPLDGTFAENAKKWGVAGINVEGSRISGAPRDPGYISPAYARSPKSRGNRVGKMRAVDPMPPPLGRWPANLILDEEAAGMLDRQSNTHSAGHARPDIAGGTYDGSTGIGFRGIGVGHKGFRIGDSGGASRFFYTAKASRSERNAGLEGFGKGKLNWSSGNKNPGSFQSKGTDRTADNFHPTVKPLALMNYLCVLTKTPTGGIVLDPFAGSGTTLLAAECHNRLWIGIEINPEYVAIANARLVRERSQMKIAI